MANTSFEETWLWQQAFVKARSDANTDEQEFFRQQFLLMRDKAAQLVSCIAADMPGFTVHDVSHLDALWDIASLLTEDAVDLNPAEGFVFGAAVLLHDVGLTIASYPNGVDDLKQTVTWKDLVVTTEATSSNDETAPSASTEDEIIALTLRRLHAEKASELVNQPWFIGEQQMFLIDETELRRFYGPSIGKIAHSHWWPLSRVELELDTPLGAFQPHTRCTVNRLEVACLLRTADALHLDRRRAPPFRRALSKPSPPASDHWAFQEKLAAPHLHDDAVVFTASEPFPLDEAEAWWLAFDTIATADKELSGVCRLLTDRLAITLRANRIRGASSPSDFARLVPTSHWIPVDSKVHVSDVPKIVETLGGIRLYGNDPSVAIRELIQNSRDAIEARRHRQNRPAKWGCVRVRTFQRENQEWIAVEDDGVGMSERILTGPLMDFGSSLWNSPLLREEFPGLAASGMRSIGRFGIGFFSVFMLGQFVRVITRRYDKGEDQARILEFRSGLKSRPILYRAAPGDAPIDGGTRVEILLGTAKEREKADVKSGQGKSAPELETIAASLAPAIDVSIQVNGKVITKALDWLRISPESLCRRVGPFLGARYAPWGDTATQNNIRAIRNLAGVVIGRACVYPTSTLFAQGVVTIGGLSAAPVLNLIGLVAGEAEPVPEICTGR